jgi:enoyl-CoA hydratase/carnithine racemase
VAGTAVTQEERLADEIQVTKGGAVIELRLNRPGKKNAITAAMYAAMADALVEAEADPAVRVVIIGGSGGIFTSGNDLKDFQQAPPVGADKPVYRFIGAIAGFSKILVAAVDGPAIGIGTTMLLHCDIVLASPAALFHLPFVDLGLVPEAASSLLFPRLVGRQAAARHLILAEPFDAKTALGYGLVAEIVEADALEARARAVAERIAAKPPEAVRIAKRLIRGDTAEIEQRYLHEGDLFAERLRSPEAAEAFQAFFEKRAPVFR